MKKIKNQKSKIKIKGFTLVELLVVISIVAILGTVAMTVFSGAQGSARDGKRRSEIDSIAKSMESSKDFVTGVYSYSGTQLSSDFPRGIASDTKYAYCVKTDTSSTPPTAPSDNTGWGISSCPTGSGYSVVSTSMSAFAAGTKAWTLCALLERSSTSYCKSSLTN